MQFVDLGGRIIRSAKGIQASADGTTREMKSLQEITAEIQDLSVRLDPHKTKLYSDDERASRKGVGPLERNAATDPKSSRKVIRATTKSTASGYREFD